jgi:hypothetical protein
MRRDPSVSVRGHSAIDPAATANYIGDVVLHQTRLRFDGLPVSDRHSGRRSGGFNCHFTGPEGTYIARLRMVRSKASGSVPTEHQPSSWPPPDHTVTTSQDISSPGTRDDSHALATRSAPPII